MLTDVETLSVQRFECSCLCLEIVFVQLKDQKHETETQGFTSLSWLCQARLKKQNMLLLTSPAWNPAEGSKPPGTETERNTWFSDPWRVRGLQKCKIPSLYFADWTEQGNERSAVFEWGLLDAPCCFMIKAHMWPCCWLMKSSCPDLRDSTVPVIWRHRRIPGSRDRAEPTPAPRDSAGLLRLTFRCCFFFFLFPSHLIWVFLFGRKQTDR